MATEEGAKEEEEDPFADEDIGQEEEEEQGPRFGVVLQYDVRQYTLRWGVGGTGQVAR